MKLAIGIDVGGTKTNIGIIDTRGNLQELKTFQTSALNPEKLKDDLLQEIKYILDKNKNIAGIGLATAGRVDFDKKSVVYATDNLRGWADTPIAMILERETGLPIFIDNDVNAALLCDLKLHPEYSHSPVTIFLTIGTGLGGAIAFNGKIMRGQTGSAGEFGHMILYPDGLKCNCGKKGCAEQYVSGTAYKQFLKEELLKAGIEPKEALLNPEVIQRKIFANETPYVITLKKMSYHLALLLESIKNCIDFDTCILGGSFSVYKDFILKEIEKHFESFNIKYQKKPRFYFTEENNYAGVIGAGLMVFENLNI